jgi:hypothetical protein
MAETAGLVGGVVALASLCNTTVEYFEFGQLGRAFGKSFIVSSNWTTQDSAYRAGASL